MLYEKFFIDMLSMYGAFICSSQFGMAIVNEDKKSSVMLLISIIQIVILIFSLKQSMQYRSVFMFFFIVAFTIIEKLYEISGIVPKYMFKTRMMMNIILCCLAMYMIII
jgi:hypothetical protein